MPIQSIKRLLLSILPFSFYNLLYFKARPKMEFKKLTDPLTINVLSFRLVARKQALLTRLRELTLHHRSGLNHELTSLLDIKDRNAKAKVITATMNKQIVAWAILSQEASTFRFPTSNDVFNKEKSVLFEVYVDPSFRRQGIATKLFNTAKMHALDNKMHICPWDFSSERFYDKVGDGAYKI